MPGYPQSAEFTAKTQVPIEILQVLHEKNKDKWNTIPMYFS